MPYYITSYNSIDLQAVCGVVTPGVSGVHDLPPLAVAVQKLPGGLTPHLTVQPDDFRTIKFSAVVVGAGHDGLVANLAALRAALRSDGTFYPLVVADRPAERIMALCKDGFQVATRYLPGDIDAVEMTIPFVCYPYWEDATEVTLLIAAALLTFRQATFEHSALDGWAAYSTGAATVDTTGPHDGDRAMKVVCLGNDGAETPEHTIPVTAEEDYSLQAYLKGAVGGETVTAAIRWYDTDDVFLSESTEAWELTDEWALYKAEGKEAPVGATSASIRITDAHASTFYVDNVCLEEASTCGAFITPYDANTKIKNDGDLTAYPTYTCTLLAGMATGLTFDIGSQQFEYEDELEVSDVLTVDCDPQLPDVELNGTRDWAGVASDWGDLALPVGWSTITLSDASKFSFAIAYRRRYL